MKKVKRAPYEYVVISVVVVLTVVLGASLYAGRTKVQKGSLLVQELSMLRSALTLYKTINKESPEDLRTLVTSEYEIAGARRPYLERLPMSKDGRIVDPFGSPYRYDPSTGWVSSTTLGYEKW